MTGNSSFSLSAQALRTSYRIMRSIREFEERLHVDFSRGEIPGFVHLYAGEEATAAAIMAHLGDGDRIASTHRGHGHCIAKGVDIISMMKEIYGRQGGACNGKGGSMHIADLSKGMMGANGILGAGAPLVCGCRSRGEVSRQGRSSDQLRWRWGREPGDFPRESEPRRVWKLPAIFVVENNGYAESTAREYATAVDSYVCRAAGFGMPGVAVDGTDFFAVHEEAGKLIQRARAGGGPALLECTMVRFFGHFEGDAQTYRGPGELDDIRANRDCLKKFAKQVTSAGLLSVDALTAIDREVRELIDEAVTQAKNAPLPALADLTTDVYVRY